MDALDEIKIRYPDKFGINAKLRQTQTHNPEFLNLTLQSYQILSFLKNEKLSIAESLRTNKNVSIFAHQILAAQRIKNELGGTALLADEVGLGKTIEACIIIKEFLTTGIAKKILILAPPSLLSQWKDELASKFDLDFINQQNDSRFIDVSSHDLLLMSHASASYPEKSKALQEVFWDLVIVDEAHSMKNSATHKHQLVKNLSKRHLLLLSATPIQNNLEELYNMIELLHPGYLGTWNQFKDKYALGKNLRSINPTFKNKLQDILSKLIIRTTRKEVRTYIKFTDRIPHTNILEPSEKELLLYNAITDVIRDLYSENYNSLALMTYQRLASSSTDTSKRALYKMKMNKVIGPEKYEELLSFANSIPYDSKFTNILKHIEKDSSKFLIFTEFYATQDYIAKNLESKGFSVILFNGKMSPDEKYEAVRQFKNKSQIMISTGAGGEGQNFQFCHNIVNYDLPWNPMKVEQRIGRVHRIGQTDDVNIYNYALKGTIEAYILELLFTKIELFNMTLGELDLIFEDSTNQGLQETWFKEYMTAKNDIEIKNKFSSLGENWKKNKEKIHETVDEFNDDVFNNFDLSALKEKK
jgi:SNF2 family DNA or RNA helicase